jgi:hypothetical protein
LKIPRAYEGNVTRALNWAKMMFVNNRRSLRRKKSIRSSLATRDRQHGLHFPRYRGSMKSTANTLSFGLKFAAVFAFPWSGARGRRRKLALR